jgi:hypothetical protein
VAPRSCVPGGPTLSSRHAWDLMPGAQRARPPSVDYWKGALHSGLHLGAPFLAQPGTPLWTTLGFQQIAQAYP